MEESGLAEKYVQCQNMWKRRTRTATLLCTENLVDEEEEQGEEEEEESNLLIMHG